MTDDTPAVAPAGDVESLIVAITDELADARGVDPLDLPPLYDFVDLDALASLYRSPARPPPRSGHVRFTVDDHEVSVFQDGSVDVTAREPEPSVSDSVEKAE